MWVFWFIASAACFAFAAYLLKKRREFHYAKKEEVYSAKAEAPGADAAPIYGKAQAEQSEILPPWAAMDAAKAPETAPPGIAAAEYAGEKRDAESEEEKNRQAAFKNLRFFDS